MPKTKDHNVSTSPAANPDGSKAASQADDDVEELSQVELPDPDDRVDVNFIFGGVNYFVGTRGRRFDLVLHEDVNRRGTHWTITEREQERTSNDEVSSFSCLAIDAGIQVYFFDARNGKRSKPWGEVKLLNAGESIVVNNLDRRTGAYSKYNKGQLRGKVSAIWVTATA